MSAVAPSTPPPAPPRWRLSLVPEGPVQPVTRGDCLEGERPCPWTSCRYHLLRLENRIQVVERPAEYQGVRHERAMEQREAAGATDTCALDVADRGEHDGQEIADLLGISRERVRQILESAERKIRRHVEGGRLAGELDE